MAAAGLVGGLFFHDRAGEVPGQDQKVVGPALFDGRRRQDRDVVARRVQPLFQGAVVDDEVDDVGAEAEVMHQGRRLGRRPVAGDGLSRCLEAADQRPQFILEDADALGETLPRRGMAEPQLVLQRDQPGHRIANRARPAGVLGDGAQGPPVTVDPEAFDHLHAGPGEEGTKRLHRVIGQMLVIDGVEQGLAVDVDQIRNLEGEHTVGRQEIADTGDDAGQVVGVGEDVVGGDHGSRPVAVPYGAGALRREEANQGLDAPGVGGGGDVAGRIDAEHAPAAFLEEPEKRPVVGADVDDQAVFGRRQAGDDVVGVTAEVIDEHRRGTRHIDVVIEQVGGVHDVQQLQVSAVLAQEDIEGKHLLRRAHGLFGDEGIGRRCRRQRQHQLQVRAAAQPAGAAPVAGDGAGRRLSLQRARYARHPLRRLPVCASCGQG